MAVRRGSFLTPAPPRVLAHRGLARDAPENTLLAFLHALAAGAAYLEIDVRASKDGVAMISHDADLSRLLGSEALVADLRFAELARCDLGEGQQFSSLRQALSAFPEARFNIDVKSADAIQPTIDAVLAERAVHRVLITSFSEVRVRRTVAGLTGVASSASTLRVALVLLACATGSVEFVRQALAGAVAVQVPERFHRLRIVSPRMLRLVHRAGAEVHVWTVNEAGDMGRLLDLGVDGLVTDHADRAVELISARRGVHGSRAN